MKTTRKIRVMLVDDHFAILMGLRACLSPETDIAVIAEATDGGEAIAQYRTHRPDITLMDLSLPRMDGVEAIRTICCEFPDARIIALTTRQGDEDIHQALGAGARSYVTKNLPRQEMLRTIRSVHEGHDYLPPAVQMALSRHEKRPPLTPRELEVLRLLTRGCSNKEIGVALGIAEITAKIHVSHLLKKMGVMDRSQAVMEALRHGIVHLDAAC